MKIMKLLFLFITALMMSSVSADNSFFEDNEFELYDDFSDRSINQEDWMGNQSFGHAGDELGEQDTPWASFGLQRMIKRDPGLGKKRGQAPDGVLHLINTLQGVVSDEAGGLTRSRLGYSLRDDGIIGVGGRLRFQDYEVYGTTGNCNGNSRARLRIIGSLFKTFIDPGTGGQAGQVLAYVALEGRSNLGLPEDEMRVVARVFKCLDSDCTIVEDKGFYPNFGSLPAGEDAEITMEWNTDVWDPTHGVFGTFIFKYRDQYGDQEASLTNEWPPIELLGRISVQAALDLPVCDPEPAFGYLNAFVDEIFVMRLPLLP